ncbi:radical SAM/SPASM domain-containing protein [Pectobacterium polaris]|uniref:radical SAM/SPASM domain-containing protein n=1 Tax=Pectobacterium polaris TaxID=2042057 RepID=UPI00158298A6|nr:radical SAM protein [Pectobacterium polaris]
MTDYRFNLKQCYLLLTRKCNLSCSHCIRSSNPSFTEFISVELCEKIFTEFSSFSKNTQLLISGGEPTLHPKFLDIVSKAYKIFDNIMINTNGLNFYKLSKLASLKDKVKIQISIDGNFRTHEYIRGIGTYHKALENINKLTALGLKVIIATTVSNNNVKSIPDLDKDIEETDFSLWNIKRIVGYGRAEDNDDISSDDWNNFFKEVKSSFLNKFRISIRPMFSIESIAKTDVINYSNNELSLRGANCGTGRSKLYINPNGSVYPCACMEHKIVGNFTHDSYSIISNELSNINIAPKKGSICQKCRLWSVCQGGCPGISERNHQNGDPRCPIVAKANILMTRMVD